MTSALAGTTLFGTLVLVVLLGRAIRARLPDTHLSADSRDAVKLAMGLVATMTALLLSLLVSSAKGTYDAQRSEIIQMAAKVAFLDRALTAYGAETAPVRSAFHDTVRDAVRVIWRQDGPAGAPHQPGAQLGDAVYAGIQDLTPQNDTQRAWKAHAATLAADLAELRLLLVAQSVSSIPAILLYAVAAWLLIIFLAFSLLAPPNGTTTLSLLAAALSVAGALFLLLELDQPLRGLICISPDPVLRALSEPPSST